MDGLHILEFNETKISVNDKVSDEMHRLRSVSTIKLCYTPMYNLDSNKFKIVFHNTRPLHHHYEQLHHDHNLKSADVIAICESRLKTSEPDETYAIEDYDIHRDDQKDVSDGRRPSHGLVTYIHHNFTVSHSNHYSTQNFETSLFNIHTNSMAVILLVVY